jgi:hypothetical protein
MLAFSGKKQDLWKGGQDEGEVVAVMVVGDMNGGLCIEQAFDTMIDICVR